MRNRLLGMIAAAALAAPLPVWAQSTGQTPGAGPQTPGATSPSQTGQNQDDYDEERQQEGEHGQVIREGEQGQLGQQGQPGQQGQHGQLGHQGEMAQGEACPSEIEGTTVVVEETPAGALVLAFANTSGQESEVQERVQQMSDDHNTQGFTGSTEGTPAFSTVEDTEFGARLILTPADPADRNQLRHQLDTVVMQMQAGACPSLTGTPQPGQMQQPGMQQPGMQQPGMQQPGQIQQPGQTQPGQPGQVPPQDNPSGLRDQPTDSPRTAPPTPR